MIKRLLNLFWRILQFIVRIVFLPLLNLFWRIIQFIEGIVFLSLFLLVHAPIIVAFPSFKEFLDWYNNKFLRNS